MEMSPDEVHKFHDELRWCITQLESGLERQCPDSRQAAETVKILKILRSSKAPLVKKRQAMRAALGDYRKKMRESEKKLLSGLRNSKFRPTGKLKSHSKSKFLRQSYSRTAEHDRLGRDLDGLCLHQQQSSQDNQGFALSVNGTGGRNVNSSNASYGAGMESSLSSLGAASSGSHMLSQTSTGGSSLSGGGVTSAAARVPSDGDGLYQFKPSGNSFCFGFGAADEEEDDDSLDVNDTEKSTGLTSRDVQSKQALDSGEVKANVFKYERADNNFCFNFGSE